MENLTAIFSNPDFIKEVPCDKVTYSANSIILDEGDVSQDLFLISSGEAIVSYIQDEVFGMPIRLAHLKANDIFGELSMFDRGARSAKVTAATDCEIFKVNGPTLIAYLDSHPETGYFVLRELFMHLITHVRQNNLRTKMALEMYFLEHSNHSHR